MTANIHAGERIIPAQQVRAMERDSAQGGTSVVNQTINVSTGVQQTVRAELQRMLPALSDSLGKSVQSQNSRNKINLGA